MRKLMFICLVFSIFISNVYALKAWQIDGNKEMKKSSSSFWKGIYGIYPVLDSAKFDRLSKKYHCINKDMEKLTFKKDSLENTLSDSIKVRRHFTFLGGVFTWPKITKQEKEQTDKKIKIRELDDKINKLKTEQKKIEKLFKKHDKYLVKKLLWNFASWEVEKEDK